MNRFLKRLRITSLSLGVIAVSGLVYNLILFAYLRPRVLNFEALGNQMETLGILTGMSLALIGFFHLAVVITLLLQIAIWKLAGALKVTTIVVGIISGLLLLSDIAMLHDIGDGYVMGWNTSGEWTILFISHGLHTLFTILAFPALMSGSKTESSREEIAEKDDVLFASVHTTGLLCGGIGLAAILLALVTRLPVVLFGIIFIPIGLLVFLPYPVILGLWLFMNRRAKVKEWFDEKQFQDISRASLWTLTITLPVMIVVGVLQRMNGSGTVWDFVWLPLYVFLSMAVFSLVTLVSVRR